MFPLGGPEANETTPKSGLVLATSEIYQVGKRGSIFHSCTSTLNPHLVLDTTLGLLQSIFATLPGHRSPPFSFAHKLEYTIPILDPIFPSKLRRPTVFLYN